MMIIRRLFKLVFLMGVPMCFPMETWAAEVTRQLPRKAFKLHAVRMAYQNEDPKMGLSIKVIDRSAQNPGVVTGPDLIVPSKLTFFAHLEPPLVLDGTRYAWAGAARGNGQFIKVDYSSVLTREDRSISLSVLDANNNRPISFIATTRARFVGPDTEALVCARHFLDGKCAIALVDAAAAHSWSLTLAPAFGLFDPLNPSTYICDADNGKCNSAKHAFWNALMTRHIGFESAEEFATAHERLSVEGTGLNAGSAHNSSVMDLDNNAGGREIGKSLLSLAPIEFELRAQSAVIDAVRTGLLTRMDDVRNVDNGSLLVPSNE